MSFENPTSEIYFLTVPLSIDRTNTIDFSNENEQLNEFIKYASNHGGYKHFTNVNIIREDKPLHIVGDFGDYYKYNYMIYKNTELSNKWWYAFITNSKYIAKETTEITFEIDEWQTFQFDTDLSYHSYIERGIIPRNKDNYKVYTQAEPLTVESSYSYQIETSSQDDWAPYHCIEAITRYDNGQNLIQQPFEYGGCGTGSSYSSLYMFPVGTAVSLEKYTRTVKFYGDLNDHRTDLVCMRIIPKWFTKSVGWSYDEDAYQNITYSGRWLSGNNTCTLTSNEYKILQNKLFNGYEPRNKKMLGSLCRSFLLFNKNGFSFVIKPELLNKRNLNTNDSIIYNLYGKPIELNNIRFELVQYADNNENYADIPYDLSFNIAYNANTGIHKALGVMNGMTQIINGGIKTYAGNKSLINGLPKSSPNIKQDRNLNSINASISTSGISEMISGGITLAQSLSSKTAGNSTVADLYHYGTDCMVIRLAEVNPSVTDCEVIDDYLDKFGYTINEMDSISKWKNTRSNWNYIKTLDCNIKSKCASRYENGIRNMFNNGVTIWHSFDSFGVYNSKVNDEWTDLNK